MESGGTFGKVLIVEFWIPGVPAPYSTRGERLWKEAIMQVVPKNKGFAGEKGVDLQFHLPRTDVNHWVPDLDNLCEPAFSVLVNKLGWFRGKRPNIWWWRASKIHKEKTGCKVRLFSGASPQFGWSRDQSIVDAVSEGSFSLLRSLLPSQHPYASGRYCLLLQFGDPSLNLGEIATGGVKSAIDCLFPHPLDRWIIDLQVEKGIVGVPKAGVKVKLWHTCYRVTP